jgi:hypothetical protein
MVDVQKQVQSSKSKVQSNESSSEPKTESMPDLGIWVWDLL